MEKEKKKRTIIPLKDLNLTSRFLFDQVMEDPQTQKEALSIIFGHEIPVLLHNETEKEIFFVNLVSKNGRLIVITIER